MTWRRIAAALFACALPTHGASAFDAQIAPAPGGPPNGDVPPIVRDFAARNQLRLGWAADLPDTANLLNRDLPAPYRDFEINYLPRDAQVLIGQTKGGYGVVAMGKASAYAAGDGRYHVSSGYGCFQISDVPGSGQYAYAECLYSEVARTAAGANAVGHEIAMPNYAGYPPTINPFQVNNSGWQAHLQLDPGGGSNPKRDFWPSSALIAAPNFGGQALRGLIFGSASLAGSNGARNVTTTIATTAGAKVVTLPAEPRTLGVVAGQTVSSRDIPSGAIVTAVFTTGNRIELSRAATSDVAAAPAVFSNPGAVAIELAPHHEIRWTNDTYGARGAFIRNDSAAGESALGLRLHEKGMSWVDPRTEADLAGVTKAGDAYARRFLTRGETPTVRDCGDAPAPPATHSTPTAGHISTGARAMGCTIVFASPFPAAAFCVLTPTNPTAARSGYLISVSDKDHFRATFAAPVDQAGFNYFCGGE
ncbi:hypothetical protein [Methylocystis parvus]|uniref:Uncharacterized protein n=1 Tax=Methylocystis parvus TaxID=134 RepID=A0A6B8M257_9HYPH|nr:hypothetical protein [Methylocystis parvus]QGM96366.1 hypothetical protein F7D14_01935 [Methylocystis parvus]WBJ99793.1 hypothetical protein MMG94_17690 [Methylocystis parvus OBBP]